MDTWIWLLIGAFVVVDAAVTFYVLRRSRRRKQQDASPATDDLSRGIGLQ